MERRVVYGGGGIIPDIFIPRDTSGITSYFSSVVSSGVIYQYALEYSDRNRERFSTFKNYKELYNYLQQQPLLEDFTDYAVTKGVKKRPMLINVSARLIENHLQAYIIRNFFDEAGFYPIFLKDDPSLQKAIKVLTEGKSLSFIEFIKQATNGGNLRSQARPAKGYGLAKERVFTEFIA